MTIKLSQALVFKNDSLSSGLKHRIEVANRAANTAEEKIKLAYKYAIEVDGLKPKEAAKVLYENLKYSPQWIRTFLPEEAKNMSKVRPNQSGYRRKLRQEALTKIESTKNIKKLVITIETPKVKSFYNDLLKIKDRAEKEGLVIHSDGTVEIAHT